MTQSSVPPPSLDSPSDTPFLLANQWKLNQALARHLTPLMESRHGVGLKNLMALGHIRSGVQYPTELAEARYPATWPAGPSTSCSPPA